MDNVFSQGDKSTQRAKQDCIGIDDCNHHKPSIESRDDYDKSN